MTQDIGNISDVITAVATIGPLIFLAIQIRDNTKMMRTSTLGSMLQNARERTAAHLCDDGQVFDIVARGVNSLDNLDARERVRFAFFMVDMALHMQHIMELQAAKLVS